MVSSNGRPFRKEIEGDWMVFPLHPEGYGLGRIARKRSVELLVYAFSRCYQVVPYLNETVHLKPADAILIARTGNLGIKTGTWQVLGQLDSRWKHERHEWPMPAFMAKDLVSDAWIRVEYSGDNLEPGPVYRTRISKQEAMLLNEDGGMGHIYFEMAVTAKIGYLERNQPKVDNSSSDVLQD